MSHVGKIALVAGRSMAGLAAAAVLSKYFERVVILDKGPSADNLDARVGVGQGRHLHNLLKSGEQSIEELLPGTGEELIAHGAVQLRQSIDTRIYDHGQWLPRCDLGYRNLSASRPLIEHVVLKQVKLCPGINLRGETTVESLSFDASGRVNGLMVRAAGGTGEFLEADLVIDCTGHLSQTRVNLRAWLRHGARIQTQDRNILYERRI